MKIGVVFPQTEIGNNPQSIKDYAQAAEELGYSHILAYEHVLGANPARLAGWSGPYTYQSAFHEPFSLFSFLAAVTEKIEFVTGILILPQRQTALVAKQSATLDILSKGRLRLGIGIGWNQVEYVSLNQDYHNRGKRVEEQVELLRLLWTQELVQFSGKWHEIPDAGINPLPIQKPIPIWFGGHADSVLRRTAHLGDGWMPNYRQPQEAITSIEKIKKFMDEYNRPYSCMGIEARLHISEGQPDSWRLLAEEWQKIGATHLSINTMNAGLKTPDEHIQVLTTFAKILALT